MYALTGQRLEPLAEMQRKSSLAVTWSDHYCDIDWDLKIRYEISNASHQLKEGHTRTTQDSTLCFWRREEDVKAQEQ